MKALSIVESGFIVFLKLIQEGAAGITRSSKYLIFGRKVKKYEKEHSSSTY